MPPRSQARTAILNWQDAFTLIETTGQVMTRAAELATDHQLGIWDAIVLSASAQAGCRLLLSEDLQDGFTWQGLSVCNPFASHRHPLLAALLDGGLD